MKTKDFSGEYDYEREEAQAEAAQFNEYVDEYSRTENIERVRKIANHWNKILDENGMAEFADEWNKHVPGFKMEVSK